MRAGTEGTESEVYAVVAGPSTAGKMARHSMMQDTQDSDDDDDEKMERASYTNWFEGGDGGWWWRIRGIRVPRGGREAAGAATMWRGLASSSSTSGGGAGRSTGRTPCRSPC